MAQHWIKNAIRRPGALTEKAKKARMSLSQFENRALKRGSRASTRTKREAQLAKTLRSFHK